MKKSIVALLLVTFILLVGCSNSQEAPSSISDGQSTTVTTNQVTTPGTEKNSSIEPETLEGYAAVETDSNVEADSNVLPSSIENLDRRGTVVPGENASPHNNSAYPPSSFYGEWVLEGFTSKDLRHTTETLADIALADNSSKAVEIFPVAFTMGDPLMKSFSEARTIAGLNYGDFYFYNQSGEKVRYTAMYDTSGNTLAVGIFENESDTVTNKKLELDYLIEWNGWRLSLIRDGQKVTYVPMSTIKDADKGVVTNCGDIVRGYTAAYEMVSIHPWWPAVRYADNPFANTAAQFVFAEDGSCNITLETGPSYDFQYRYSGNAMTLLEGNKMYLYSWLADWKKSILADSVDADILNGMTDEEMVRLAQEHDAVLSGLQSAFDAAGLDINIDEVTGQITMDSKILFAYDDARLSNEGKAFLDSFLGVYAAVILSDEYSDYVSHIVIEGHTDTSGTYDYNLALSEARAKAVADYCISESRTTLSNTELEQFSSILTTVGRAYDEPIYNENSEVDMAASRRVVFNFMMNTGR